MNSDSKMWRMIAIVSLIIAVVALIMPFVIPAPEGPEGPQGVAGEDGQDGDDGDTGPQGDTGAQGSQGPQGLQGLQGPPGPGTMMAWSSFGANIEMGACASIMNVTITVPSDGSIVVSAWQFDRLDHTIGTSDSYVRKISTTEADCVTDVFFSGSGSVPADAATGIYYQLNTLQRIYDVGAGTHTFHVSGRSTSGLNPGDQIVRGNVVAVFYPS